MKRLFLLLLLCVPVVCHAQDSRDLSISGSISGGFVDGASHSVQLTLTLGASLPPESSSDISVFTRTLERDTEAENRKLIIGREALPDIDFRIDDFFVHGSLLQEANDQVFLVPVTLQTSPGTEVAVELQATSNFEDFFALSFPIQQLRNASLPNEPMPILRAMRILIDEAVPAGGLNSCQLLDIFSIVRKNIDFFDEGDALVVRHILDYLKSNNSLEHNDAGRNCDDRAYGFARFHAEIMNDVLFNTVDRSVRGDSLHTQATENLIDIYGGSYFISSIPEADRSVEAANELERPDLCMSLSSTLLNALKNSDPQDLKRNVANVRSILTQITVCARIVNKESENPKPNAARNNVEALQRAEGGQRIINRFVETVTELNSTGVINILNRGMKDLRLNFDTFEEFYSEAGG